MNWKVKLGLGVVVFAVMSYFFTKPLLNFSKDDIFVEYVKKTERSEGINMAFTERDDKKGQYTVVDDIMYFHRHSDSTYGELEPKSWCKFRATGVRSFVLSWHRNIIDVYGCRETKEEAAKISSE